jgi:hypothetical protein
MLSKTKCCIIYFTITLHNWIYPNTVTHFYIASVLSKYVRCCNFSLHLRWNAHKYRKCFQTAPFFRCNNSKIMKKSQSRNANVSETQANTYADRLHSSSWRLSVLPAGQSAHPSKLNDHIILHQLVKVTENHHRHHPADIRETPLPDIWKIQWTIK